MRAIGAALRQRDLRLLLSAGLVSLVGDWVLRVGLACEIYALTGSTLASALMLLSSFTPQIVLGSVAGVFVDRWDLRRTMVLANVLLAAGLVPLLVVHRANQAWIVYAVTAVEGCVQQFFFPAQQSAIPKVTDDEHLMTANALSSQSIDLSRLGGSALGGLLAAVGGIALVTLADMVSFLMAAVVITRIAIPRRVKEGDRPNLRGQVTRLRAEWTDGLAVTLRQPVLRVIMVCVLIVSVGEGIMGTLFAPFVRSILHANVSTYGIIVAAEAIGGIAGGLYAASIGPKMRAARALGLGAIMLGALELGLFTYPLGYPRVWPAIVLMILVGLPGAVLIAAAITLFQRYTLEGHRGRFFGMLNTAEGVALVAGTLLAGFLGKVIGIIPMLVVQGVGYLLAGVIVLVLIAPREGGPNADAIAPRDVDASQPQDEVSEETSAT